MRSAVVLADSAGSGARTPPIKRAVNRVAPAVDEVVVSCRREQRESIEAALKTAPYRLAMDPVPGRSPVADIRSGCRVARGAETFVMTPDADGVRPGLVTELFEACELEGAVPRIDGENRPLTAVYDTAAAIAAADVTLGMGSASVTEMLDRLAMQALPVPSVPK